MNSRERESLDRYITGNYGEDQFRGEDEIVEPSPAPWKVNPQYGKENVYRLWNGDSNYHDDTSPEAMDANCRLMEAAPDLLEACKEMLKWFGNCGSPAQQAAANKATAAVAKAQP